MQFTSYLKNANPDPSIPEFYFTNITYSYTLYTFKMLLFDRYKRSHGTARIASSVEHLDVLEIGNLAWIMKKLIYSLAAKRPAAPGFKPCLGSPRMDRAVSRRTPVALVSSGTKTFRVSAEKPKLPRSPLIRLLPVQIIASRN